MRNLSVVAQFRRVWSLLDAARRRRFLRLQLLSFCMALSTLAGLAAVLPFLKVLSDPSLIERNPWLAGLYAALGSPGHRAFLVILGAAFVLLVWISNAVNFFGFRAIKQFAHDCCARLQEMLFDEYLHRDCLFHARSDSAVLGSRAVRHVEAFALGTLQGLLLLVAGLATCLLVFGSVLAFHPAAALFAVLVFGGAYAAIYHAVRLRLRRNGRLQAQRWDERARVMAAGFGAVKEILLLGNQKYFRDLFAQQSATIARTGADSLVIAQLPRHLIECVAAASLVAAAFWFGGSGDAGWFAELTFFALAAYRLMPALQQTFAALAQIGAGDAAFENIEADLESAIATDRARAPQGVAPAWDVPRREIRLSHVSFRYAPGLPLAIRDVSLSIPAGARVALVGANGSGKSTLADLIVGLLRPESGDIHVDDLPLDDERVRAWQANIAYVPQAVFLQNASVAENIALGVPRDEIDRARVRAVLRQVQLEGFVDSLPAGCDEALGERGVRISGGQRQLIGIARALYRDARVLVLDEATHALDAHHERQVIAALHAGQAARITILIAHHPAPLRDCDLVFELAAGELVATRCAPQLHQEAS